MQRTINILLSSILFVMLFLPAIGAPLPAWSNIALGIAALIALILSIIR